MLIDGTALLDGIRFLGGTLWTDFQLETFSLTHAFRSAQVRNGTVDYHRICTVTSLVSSCTSSKAWI